MSGICGVYSVDKKNVADEILLATIALQHRGEEGCGISLPKEDGFYTLKSRQLAYYFFRDAANGIGGLRRMSPIAAIGHTLYENNGGLQPVEEWVAGRKILSVAMDGVLLGFGGKNDSVMRKMFSRYLDETGSFYEAARNVMEKLRGRGSYCVVALVKEREDIKMIAFRDPKGIKPYCLGKKEDGGKYIVASESKVLDGVEADFIRDIEPGEIIIFSEKGLESRVLAEERHSHCAFEWVYFADPTSIIEGKDVYEVRKELGRKLARRYDKRLGEIDFVMASPDSGRSVAIGFQQELSKLRNKQIGYEEAAIKNPGAKRTFQVEDEEERKLAARVKFFMNKKLIKGKNIAVGDDSIVRGTVFREGMIDKLRKAGANKIYAVISCPALLYACIKDPKETDFAAHGLNGSVEEVGERVARKINADYVCYPTRQELVESIGIEDICFACGDGCFPVNEEFLR